MFVLVGGSGKLQLVVCLVENRALSLVFHLAGKVAGHYSKLATFRRKKEKLRGGWGQSANFASECARKLLIL